MTELTQAEIIDPGRTPGDAPFEQLEAIPVARRRAILSVASGLIDRAGPIWDGVYLMDEGNPAKDPLRPIAEAVLNAAFPPPPA